MTSHIRSGVVLTLLLACWATPGFAQRGGGDLSFGVPASQQSRLDILENAFRLTGDQKDEVERILNAAHKSAAPVREQLAKTRAAISAAVMAGNPQAQIDQTISAYATQATAMAELEMKALADVLKSLTPEQQGNGAALRAAFFLARGMFLDNRRWNAIPEHRGY